MLKALMKKQLREIWALYTIGRKSGEAKKKTMGNAGFIVLYAICFLSLGVAFYGMSSLLGDTIFALGQDWLFFGIMGLMGFSMGIIGSAFSTSSMIYRSTDNEFLLSLPIKPIYILSTRMIAVYIISFMFEFIVLLPSSLYYLRCGRGNILTLILGILLTLIMNALCVAVASVLGWVIAWIASKLKNKSIITVLISIVLIGGYYIFYFNIQNLLTSLATHAEEAGRVIKSYIYPFYLYGKAATGDILSFVLFLLICTAAIALVCWVLSKNFMKIVMTSSESVDKKVKTSASDISSNVQTNSASKALLKRELRHFSSSAAYMLNTAMGVLFFLAGAVVLVIKAADIRAYIMDVTDVEFYQSTVSVILLAAAVALSSFNDITAPSISLEGRNLWILRTAPCSAADVFNSKINLHMIISLPPTLILIAAACIVLKIKAYAFVMLMLCGFLAVYLFALSGLILNLKMPKMEWTNETVPIKQSASVAIELFLGIPVAAILCGPYFIPAVNISGDSYLAIVMAALVLACRILKNWLNKKGTAIWESL